MTRDKIQSKQVFGFHDNGGKPQAPCASTAKASTLFVICQVIFQPHAIDPAAEICNALLMNERNVFLIQ